MQAIDFLEPMNAALRSYDRHVVCLEKPPLDCQATILSLITKAIKAFEERATGMRHGISLDNHITIILTQANEPKDLPLIGIYFNLRSPYLKEKKGSHS